MHSSPSLHDLVQVDIHSQLVHAFSLPLVVDDEVYAVRVRGRARDDGRWEGWLEFEPGRGGRALRTPRETTQPSKDALRYWAAGLELVYLEGALARAQ